MNDPHTQGLYPKATMANLLNISERRIEQLAKDKVIPKAGRGVFDLGPTVNAYVRYLQGLCAGSLREGKPTELERRLQEARVLERESKARQAKYRADMMERELADSKILPLMHEIPERLSSRIYVPDEIKRVLCGVIAEIVGEVS